MTPAGVAQNYVDGDESEKAVRYLMDASAPEHPALTAPAARLEVTRMEHLRHKDGAALARCRTVLSMELLPGEKLAARLLLADVLITLDRLDEAEPLLNDLRAEAPLDETVAALAWRFSVASLLHDRAGAVAWLRWLSQVPAEPQRKKVVELMQRVFHDRPQTGAFWSADFLLSLGEFLQEQNDFALAESAYASIPKHWREWKPDVVLSKRAWNFLRFNNDEALAQAMTLFNRLVSEHPKSDQVPPALFRLHFLYWNCSRDFEKANGCLQQIIDRYPKAPEARQALFQLAAAEGMRNHKIIAIALFTRIVREYPEDAAAAQVNIDRLTGKRKD